MTLIVQIVLPMFLLILVGFYAGRFGNFSNALSQGISRFLGLYALPGLLFSAMAKTTIPDPVEWGYVGAFFIAAFLVFALGSGWRLLAGRRDEMAIVGFATSFSSIGLLGAPILMDAYGSGVALPLMLLILFQSPLLFTTVTVLAESQRSKGGRPLQTSLNAIKATLLSPMIVAMALGLVANALRLPVPDAVMKAASLIGGTVLPCACFTLGTALAYSPLTGRLVPATVMALMKVGVHPALTWVLAAKVFHLPPEWLAPAVTAAALPIGINVYGVAERYQSGKELVSMSLLISSLLSPLSISLAYWAVMG